MRKSPSQIRRNLPEGQIMRRRTSFVARDIPLLHCCVCLPKSNMLHAIHLRINARCSVDSKNKPLWYNLDCCAPTRHEKSVLGALTHRHSTGSVGIDDYLNRLPTAVDSSGCFTRSSGKEIPQRGLVVLERRLTSITAVSLLVRLYAVSYVAYLLEHVRVRHKRSWTRPQRNCAL